MATVPFVDGAGRVVTMFWGRGFRLGRVGGIAISIDYSWFIIFALFVYLLGQAYLPVVVPGGTPVAYWGMATMVALLFFGSVLVHELSHSVVARRAGIPVNNITLFIFGGVSQLEDEPHTPWDEFKMAIAGPLASIGIAVLFFAASLGARVAESPLLFASFTYLWFINVLLAVFNLLPGFPLDGGRVFRALVWRISGNLRQATRIAAISGEVFGWIFIALGVGSLFIPQIRAFSSIWMALIGWFLISAARSSYQQVVLKEMLSRVPITDVMNPEIEEVSANISVEHLVTGYFLRESASTLPVEENGRIIGMVSIEDVRKVPREQWATTLVRDIVPPFNDEQMLHTDDDAWNAANRMAQTNRDRVLVRDGDHVEGVVTRGAIARWLQTHNAQIAPGQA